MAKEVGGRVTRAGGWGWRLHRGCGGYGLSIDCLTAATRMVEQGNGPVEFIGAALTHFNVGTFREVVDIVNSASFPVSTIAGLVPSVLNLAKAGDTFSEGLVKRSAADCAGLIEIACEGISGKENELELFLTGGIIVGSEYFRKQVVEKIRFRIATINVVDEPARYCLRHAACFQEANL